MRIYVDMDGTIADLFSKILQFRRENINSEFFEYPWAAPGIFANLEPLPDSIESVNYLSSMHDVWFLSRPSFHNTSSYTEKADWIRKHFGYEMQKRLILAGDKSLLIGDILIDDADNANQENFIGTWIKIGSPEFSDWKSVLKEIHRIDNLKKETI